MYFSAAAAAAARVSPRSVGCYPYVFNEGKWRRLPLPLPPPQLNITRTVLERCCCLDRE